MASFLASLLVPGLSFAEYIAVGDIEGNVCKGFVIEMCETKKLAAVKGKDGRLYTITEKFDSVSEYNEHKGRCWIRTKNSTGGIIAWASNAAFQPEFYEKSTSGEFKKLDVEYVTFKCVKR